MSFGPRERPVKNLSAGDATGKPAVDVVFRASGIKCAGCYGGFLVGLGAFATVTSGMAWETTLNVLTIQHATIYRYRRPVIFGEHRLMLRPRDGHDLRLLATELDISPCSKSRWAYDVLGNSVTIVCFSEPASELRLVSKLTIERYGSEPPRGEIEESAIRYPFIYSMQDRFDLGRMLEQHYLDPADRVGIWARGFVLGKSTDTLALLGDLNAGIRAQLGYQSREEEGTQTPVQTLQRGWGSCRDFAVLLAEAARGLGFGARVVTGYLYVPATDAIPHPGTGATHAWAEIFIPGPGWIAFDPTNGTVGGHDLIRVAVARDIHQIVPVSGSFLGTPDDYLGMDVAVTVLPALPGT
jgi:transglutaminase-like putative cysteine protease